MGPILCDPQQVLALSVLQFPSLELAISPPKDQTQRRLPTPNPRLKIIVKLSDILHKPTD